MRIACWTLKAKNTPSECVILIAFPLQKWLNESASELGHSTLPGMMHVPSLVYILICECRFIEETIHYT